jgi:pimeloyl-ACP methyl ester carboxylesterase
MNRFGRGNQMKNRSTVRNLVCAALVGGCAVLGAHSRSSAGQIAASVEYDFVPRPTGLSDDFQSIAGTSLRFMSIKAIDGFQIEAALWQPDATDNFLDVRRDIEAAVQVARALGYKKLVLQGHSLGTIQVQFFAATNWDPDIKAVILLGPFGNLPWKSRNLLVQDETRFRALIEASMKSLRDGTFDQVLPVKMRFSNPVTSTTASAGPDIPVTGQHFLTYRWDSTSIADGTFWIHRIPRPIILVRDQSDGIIQPFEPHMLLSAAHSEGSMVTSIDFVLLPDSKPMSVNGHYFQGNEQPLTDLIGKWLADRQL